MVVGDVAQHPDRRLAGNLILVGAVLAVIGNAAHPFLDPEAPATEVLATAADSGYWTVLHLGLAIAGVLLTCGVVLVTRMLAGTPADGTARVAAVLAVIGGTLFAVQIGGIDGTVFPVLGERVAGAADEAVLLPVAEAFQRFDIALLSLVVMVYFGATFVALGLAFRAVDVFAGWLDVTALVAGVAGVVVGAMMFLELMPTFTFYAFRVVALAVTVVAFGVAAALLRRPAHVDAAAPATG